MEDFHFLPCNLTRTLLPPMQCGHQAPPCWANSSSSEVNLLEKLTQEWWLLQCVSHDCWRAPPTGCMLFLCNLLEEKMSAPRLAACSLWTAVETKTISIWGKLQILEFLDSREIVGKFLHAIFVSEDILTSIASVWYFLLDWLNICQGCGRFLTISYPRWDQPISDIFI